MSQLVEHARRELSLAGLDKPDADYGGAIATGVLELIEVFAKQGHSGESAGQTIRIFKELATFSPLTPLTGEESEWNEVADDLWQNNRNGNVFKNAAGEAWDNEGVVFRDDDGTLYTNRHSRRPVHFPYTPQLTIEVRSSKAEPLPDQG